MPKHACGHVRPNQTVWQLIISRVKKINLGASCSRAFAKARCKSEKVPWRMFWTAQHFQQKGKVDMEGGREGGREGSERATACRDLCGVCATAHCFFFFFSGHRLAGSGHARIHFLEGMCDGISAWNLANEFTRSRNLSQIFPEHTRHCPGDAGFNVSQGGMHIHTHMEIYFRM